MIEGMADTLCFIPCCKTKTAGPDYHAETPVLTAERIPKTWQRLQAGRKEMSSCIEKNSPPCRALLQYDGGLYNARASFRDDLVRGLSASRLDLYILSAVYGVVHALDPIHPYEAEMKGKVATMWGNIGLPAIIAELIHAAHARKVFGFFAGPAHWSGAHAKYRHFFTEGVKAAALSGIMLETAACFYRDAGQGTRAITGALGRALLHGLHEDFSPRFLTEYASGRTDGGVIIRAEVLVEPVPATRWRRKDRTGNDC